MQLRSIAKIVVVLIFGVSTFAQMEPGQDFDYLKVDGHKVVTTHAAGYEMSVDKSFKLLGEFHHQPIYSEKEFYVSLAAFVRGEHLLIVHAETYADGSGGLDYSDLSPANLDGLRFWSRTQCVTEEDRSEIESNPEIKFIQSNGYRFEFPFQLEQSLATSEDGTAEIVISLGRTVKDCGTSEGARLRRELESFISLSRRKIESMSGTKMFSRVWLPHWTDCEFEISEHGILLRGEVCRFYNSWPDTAYSIRSIRQKGNRLTIQVESGSEPKEWALKLRGTDSVPATKIFFDLFSPYHTQSLYGDCESVKQGRTTRYELLLKIGFPSRLKQSKNRQVHHFGLEYGGLCNSDNADIYFEGDVVEMIAAS
ncbi:MAG: hypothetical protein J5I65_05070 [Aridibacter famidurans]|nr:hypothetical protein [Aridibacter famidurans]